MTLKALFTEMSKPLHQHIYDKVELLEKDLSGAITSNSMTHNELAKVREELIQAQKVTQQKIPIEEFLSGLYTKIPNIAYKFKRGKDAQNVWLNQMITPNAWEVQNFIQLYVKHDTNMWNKMQILGDALAKHTTWVDEQKLYNAGDFYLYPEETLTTHKAKCDCEDVSYTMTSFAPTLMGVCYGFYVNGTEKFGHAYPIFLYDGKLYIIETTGTRADVTGFDDARYETYFIVTQQSTYQVKSGVAFGYLASWT